MQSIKLVILLCALCVFAKGQTTIQRETFSVSLPAKWTEDKQADLYEPTRHVFFENSESCIIFLQILDADSGMEADRVLEKFLTLQKKRIKPTSETTFSKWGSYEGKGVLIKGKMMGAYPAHARLFVFEAGGRIVFTLESALDEDWAAFKKDFALFQATLKIQVPKSEK